MPPPDSSLVAAWLAFLTPISIAILTITQLLIARRQSRKAEEVKAALVVTNGNVSDKLHEVHTLVNSERGTLLEMYAANAEALAGISNTPKSAQVAKDARTAVIDHQRKQFKVDESK